MHACVYVCVYVVVRLALALGMELCSFEGNLTLRNNVQRQLTRRHPATQVDLRRKHSWTLRLHEVSTGEAAEVLAINTLAPYVPCFSASVCAFAHSCVRAIVLIFMFVCMDSCSVRVRIVSRTER